MSKVIKLVTRVGDEEVVVGSCHPGQARILRKNGMAEWDKGKLVLVGAAEPLPKEAIPVSTEDFIEMIDKLKPGEKLERGPDGSFRHIPDPEWKGTGTFQKDLKIKGDSWLDEVDLIDPKEELMSFGWSDAPGWNEANRLHPEEIRCETLVEWATEAKTRMGAGHSLLLADDPKRMMLGFVDDEDNKIFLLPLRKIKAATEEDFQEVGLVRGDLSTKEGRMKLLGSSEEGLPSWGDGDGDGLPVEADPELEALWIQEVEDTVGAEIRQGESIRLADEWAKLAKFEPLEGGE